MNGSQVVTLPGAMAGKNGQGPVQGSIGPTGVGVLFPDHYSWFVLAAVLDVMLTHTIIERLGGVEVNTIADCFIRTFDWWGAIGLKFSVVTVVLIICEIVGSKNLRRGRRLATAAVVIGFFPVVVGLTQVAGAVYLGKGVLISPEEFGEIRSVDSAPGDLNSTHR